jgi:multidrug resistance protein, MATE family
MQATPRSEILGLASPILFGQLAAMAHGVLDTVMSGHASTTDLAAVGIGGNIFGSVFITLMGVVTALNPIVAQHYGAGSDGDVGTSYSQGLWLAVLLSLVGIPPLAFANLWLHVLDSPPAVAARVADYLLVLSFALPASLLFRAIYAFNTAVSRPRKIVVVQLLGLGLKVALNYLLVFGPYGLPKLGALGCALASLVVFWMQCLLAWLSTRHEVDYARFRLRYAAPSLRAIKEQLRLGVPMGASYAIEATSFSFLALVGARLGTSVIAGQQIIMNLAAVCYQLPLALGIATATATAQAIGAGSPQRARKLGLTGIRLGLYVASFTALSVWLLRSRVVALYTRDGGVAVVALSLVPYLALFHVFDALQSITGFVLRAYKIAVAPMLIAALMLWGVGLVGGYLVAFYPLLGPARGVQGMWLMQAVALFATALMLLVFYVWIVRAREQTQ